MFKWSERIGASWGLWVILGIACGDTRPESLGQTDAASSGSSSDEVSSSSASSDSSSSVGGSGGTTGEGGGSIALVPGPIALVPVVEGLEQPIYGAATPDDPSRLYIVEKIGRVRLRKNGTLLATPFVDVSGLIEVPKVGQELGLLSMTLAPDYVQSGRFFLLYSTTSAKIKIGEFKRDSQNPDLAEPNIVREVFSVDNDAGHIGGATVFGPDGLLYVALGNAGTGQDPGTKFGKILRIDVDTYPIPPPGNLQIEGADPDVWAMGFHNPWRFSFDRKTTDLFIGDVGASPAWEEVNRQKLVDGPQNYGFPNQSGAACLVEPCDGFRLPSYAYWHDEGRCAVMGGYVYRGKRLAWLDGEYIFADLCSREILGLKLNDSPTPTLDMLTPTYIDPTQLPKEPVGFIEDGRGELYVVDLKGTLLRLEPKP